MYSLKDVLEPHHDLSHGSHSTYTKLKVGKSCAHCVVLGAVSAAQLLL